MRNRFESELKYLSVVEDYEEEPFVVMKNNFPPLLDFLLEMLQFAESQLSDEDDLNWFEKRGSLQLEFLLQYKQDTSKL